MNNLHRELAPISTAAWAEIEAEARRTFSQHIAGRRVVDVSEPGGDELAAVATGHQRSIEAPLPGVQAHQRLVAALVELRIPFTVERTAVDDVERGARDSDWQPVKDAARQAAYAEDRLVFDGYGPADITGIRGSSSNASIALPSDVRTYPDVVSQAISQLRLAGVGGPFALVLSAQAYTAVSETSDHGYPIREHLARLVGGEIVWAPAIDGGLVLSTRGGDHDLRFGQDLSIGYLSHDADTVQLYFQETLTFLDYTPEASVTLAE